MENVIQLEKKFVAMQPSPIEMIHIKLSACLLVHSCQKIPFLAWFPTPAGDSPQPIRPADSVAYDSGLAHWATWTGFNR